ncbi:thermonuclease family protein [Microvirga sp. VF16]|uniref:thermonuclease family protein n=1 Tax=Microvirga sp. VF16 TaxID=2807101 RepID=UPI00193D6A7C|nr:thermonuclease family protein [Microvirga sp. VF16]QRM34842.1 thermonuclease family protein [Microvirga sp. VF16]
MNLADPAAIALVVVCLLWVWIRYSAKQTINPRNLCVIDGDTVWILGPDRSVSEKIRLQNVNAPELRRPRSRRELNKAVAATEFLRDRVERARSATIRRRGKDRYGRTLARIAIDGSDLGHLLVRAGHAKRWT